MIAKPMKNKSSAKDTFKKPHKSFEEDMPFDI